MNDVGRIAEKNQISADIQEEREDITAEIQEETETISAEIQGETETIAADIQGENEPISAVVDAVPGETRTEGKSAYEVAVKNGFIGSEAEWLESLKGKPGADGISPSANVTKTYSGAVITIKDKTGTTTTTITNGSDGKDGVPATHSWNDTILTVTSASGTSSADLKGNPGDDGYTPVKGKDYFDGKDGKDGTSVTVKSISESTADGGSNVVTFSDGKTLTVKNGKKGTDGKTPVKGVDYLDGKDGYTPVKGVDYFDGTDGQPGKDGADGYTPVKGKDYFDGKDGKDGADGVSVTVKSVSESTADGGSNVVTFSDGKTLTVKNGSKGSTGAAGKDGSNGADGVSVSSVKQTTTSNADGGSNVATVTLSNGTTSTFTVKNGSKGSTGDTGAAGKTAYAYAQDGGFTGTEAEFAAKMAIPIITPEMYGAKGDGATDDSAAIQAAINAVKANGVVYLAKKYKISTGLLIANKDYTTFRCDGEIVYGGTGAAITLSNDRRVNIDVNIIRAPNGTALKFDTTSGEVNQNIINIRYIKQSKIGVHLYTAGGGAGHNIFYNKFHLEGEISGTETCIHIEPTTALINENFFWLGRLHGGDGSGNAKYGIKMVSPDTFGGTGVNGNANRNVFFCGDMEGVSTCGIYLHNANGNVFRNFRFEEAYGANSVTFSGECFANDIEMSMVILDEVDITGLVSSVYNKYPNIIRSLKIKDDDIKDTHEVYVTYEDGITTPMAKVIGAMTWETWAFTLEDGTVVEKKVAVQ